MHHAVVRRSPCRALSFALAGAITLSISALRADGEIHTNRPSPRILPLPKEDDAFHFVIFGDRTGGPADGIRVLAQAVEDTNLLDPDLVMTVGDLINGYNQTETWMEQMHEFRRTMDGLEMPWFPVAGNHDIFWRRDPNKPEAKPEREHEDHYVEHFGPLWYWFEHKDTGFLVLFTDEGLPDGRQRDYGDREQQKFSAEQTEWLRGALEAMKGLDHIFVFLHHPRWISRYPGSEWDEVHALLAANGNVRAVIAGHIHRMMYSGERDGIGYYALAATGASLPADLPRDPYLGYLHHYNVVTVRKDGFSMASIPVGGVFDPKQFDAARDADVDALRYLHHEAASPPIEMAADGSANAFYKILVRNPSSIPIDAEVLADGLGDWTVVPDHRHAEIAPGARREFVFACVREAKSFEGYRAPTFELRFDALAPGVRMAMASRSLEARAVIASPAEGWPAARVGHLAFDGKGDCLRIDPEVFRATEGAFTIEAWVNGAEGAKGAIVSSRHDGAGFGLEVGATPSFVVGAEGRWVSARAEQPLPGGRWVHLAGTWDGESIALWVDGAKAAEATCAATVASSRHPIYVGARPDLRWILWDRPTPIEFWTGGIDEIRLTRGARYREPFAPSRALPRDESAAFALACDATLGPFVLVDSAEPMQAIAQGDARLAADGP